MKKSKSNTAFIVIISIEVAILVIMAMIITFSLLGGVRRVYADEHDMSYDLTNERYSEIAWDANRGKYLAKKQTKEYKKYVAIGEYFNADFVYLAYEAIGREGEKAKLKTKMEDAKKRMDNYSFVSDSIDRQLKDYLAGINKQE